MSYMVNLVMKGRAAVVVGGGEVASRKVQDLLAAEALVTVVAPKACARIVELAEEKRIQAQWREYRKDDLAGAFVAIAATDDEELNSRVADDAMAENVLVNVVDRPAFCTFTLPAVVCRGDLKLGVSTEGRCPALSSILREELEGEYGPEYAELVDLFGELRKKMIARSWEGPRIREALAGIYRGGVMEAIAAGNKERLKRLIGERLGADFDRG